MSWAKHYFAIDFEKIYTTLLLSMSVQNRILEDHQKMILSLSADENKLALECARKVKSHLEKAFLREQHPKFLENIELVDRIISKHMVHLNQLQNH